MQVRQDPPAQRPKAGMRAPEAAGCVTCWIGVALLVPEGGHDSGRDGVAIY